MNAAPRFRRDYRSANRDRSREKRATTFTPRPLTDREAAKRFKASVVNFGAKQLASAAQRSIDSAKSWKAGRACPNAASLINMARQLPSVRAWLAAEIEPGVSGPAVLTRVLSTLPADDAQALLDELARRA